MDTLSLPVAQIKCAQDRNVIQRQESFTKRNVTYLHTNYYVQLHKNADIPFHRWREHTTKLGYLLILAFP
jgi:hypothetical protein